MKIKLLAFLLLLSTAWLAAVDIPQNTNIPPISVSLTGYVEHPGVYQLTPLNRLSDILAMDEALSLEAANFRKLQALRSIKLIRDGRTTLCDLLRFYRLGEIEQNPYLKDGDVVLIGAINDLVSISGGINLPGDLEFVPGDKLENLIELAKGFSYDADPAKVQIYRYQANRIDYEVINLNYTQNTGFLLQADDRILIPQDSEIRSRYKVTISGQVKNPGEYVISKNTTLNDLLLQAGGLTSRGDLKGMVYFSENLNSEPKPYLDMLMQRSMSDMSPLEYSYLRTNLLQLKGKYSLDTERFISSNGKEANPLLHDGDHIYIPEKLDMVWVSGQVRNPGMVPWVEGKDWDYYILTAGGYSNNRKVGRGRLIRGLSGNWVKPSKDVPIRPGDTIFVPGQTDRSLWVDVKDIVTLTSSLITIIIGVQALTSK